MIIEAIRLLCSYSARANRRINDTAQQLLTEKFLQEASPSHETLRNTLVHRMSGQWIWLERWKATSPGDLDLVVYLAEQGVR